MTTYANLKGGIAAAEDMVKSMIAEHTRSWTIATKHKKQHSWCIDIATSVKGDVSVQLRRYGGDVNMHPNYLPTLVLEAFAKVRRAVDDWKAGKGEFPPTDFFVEAVNLDREEV